MNLQEIIEKKVADLNYEETEGRWVIKSVFSQGVKPELDKLIKRAIKLGVAIISYEVVEERTLDVKGCVFVEVVRVVVDGESPKLSGGWEFLAKITHLPEGNLVLKPNSKYEIPVEYRESDCTCDHCGVNRLRKETFLVKNQEGGILKVGRSCLKDFLGYHNSPENILKYFKLYEEIEDSFEFEGGSSRIDFAFDLKAVANITVAAISQHGYYNNAKAEEFNTMSTRNTVFWSFQPKKNNPLVYKNKDGRVIANEDHENQANSILWNIVFDLSKSDLSSDFEHNLKIILSKGYVSGEYFAIVVGAIAHRYFKDIKTQEKKVFNPKTTSEWVGDISKRYRDVPLTLIRVNGFESLYGYTNVLTFSDDSDNELVWFTGSDLGIKMGDKIKATFTVKSHDEYKGVKNTKISRVSFKDFLAMSLSRVV